MNQRYTVDKCSKCGGDMFKGISKVELFLRETGITSPIAETT